MQPLDERKAKMGSRVEENATFSIHVFLARHPHCITIGYFLFLSFSFVKIVLSFIDGAVNIQLLYLQGRRRSGCDIPRSSKFLTLLNPNLS